LPSSAIAAMGYQKHSIHSSRKGFFRLRQGLVFIKQMKDRKSQGKAFSKPLA
jgi:hypothetical protein